MGNLEQFSEDFGVFLAANKIWIIAVAAVILIAGALVLMRAMRKKHELQGSWTIRELSMAAMCLALAFLLSFIRIFALPQGGSVTPASMLPIMLFAYIYGTPKGLIVGLAYGLLQCLQDFWVIHWAQFFLDYIAAFMVLGLAGMFKKNIFPGMALACVLRFVCHVLSGVIFFASYAGDQNVWLYSLGYNSFVLVELAICIVITVIPPVNTLIKSLKAQADKRKSVSSAA